MRNLSTAVFLLICICICMCRDSFHADAADIMTQGQQITDWESLVSPNGVFQLAFFSTRQSRNRYLGVRYNKGGRWVVWVANPENPIMDSSGILSLDNNGTLKLTYTGANPIVLNSSQNVTSSSNVTAKLLNSGNLVLLESDLNGTTKRVLWESFDSASDSLLPGMKIGVNFKTGQNWTILSWISDKVPALGGFVLGGDPNGSSQLYVWRRGEVYWRSGLWNGRGFDNIPQFTSDHNRFNFSYVSNADEKYFMYEVKDNSTDSMWVLDWWGQIAQFPEGSIVSCKGNSSSHNKGCVESKVPECRNKDVKFVMKTGSINPSFPLSYEEDPSLSISDCDEKCWNNCSCFAYSSMHDNGTGCMFGLHKLSFVEGNVGDVRVLPLHQGGSTKKKWWPWLVISVSVALLMLVLVFFCHRKARGFLLKEKKETNQEMLVRELGTNITPKKHNDENNLQDDRNQDQEFQFFRFDIIMAATDNFSATNKLGEGGFGPVYKGKLLEGQEIAVKRLSRSSGQGLEEFKNEVILIAKLQHMNLVRLLGCCFQGEERMLIYEYMPNKSLDSFLFGLKFFHLYIFFSLILLFVIHQQIYEFFFETDTIKSELLDWRTRFNIIEGIAQGLLYLHKYSRLRIIHRDLKASNILLDDQMNPKISDFGMARIFGRNESEAKTNRVVGTYGYMSPEYAMEGIFSVKSDVFSFGVLLLEIISGKKNTKFYHPDRQLNLIGYAWESWKDGIILELMDPTLGASCPEHEFLVCIHVGLLCVQESAEDRPTMSEVLSMLSNEVATLPPPKEPAFFTGGGAIDEKLYKGISESCSINDVTISELDAR